MAVTTAPSISHAFMRYAGPSGPSDGTAQPTPVPVQAAEHSKYPPLSTGLPVRQSAPPNPVSHWFKTRTVFPGTIPITLASVSCVEPLANPPVQFVKVIETFELLPYVPSLLPAQINAESPLHPAAAPLTLSCVLFA